MPAGVNVRTEYFLRQLYAPFSLSKLVIKSRPEPLAFPPKKDPYRISYTQQTWDLPLNLKDEVVKPNRPPSKVMIRAVFPLKKLTGEGNMRIHMVGLEQNERPPMRPKPLTDPSMRVLNITWRFSLNPPMGGIGIGQPGKPRVDLKGG
jgi:hypothetical protein